MTTPIPPTPLRFDDETVTFSRAAFDAFLRQVEDLEDLAAVDRAEAERARLGDKEYRRLCYTMDEVHRVVHDGVSDVTIWRERAGLTQRALAEAAGVSPSYLAEIEGGKKPGSAAALCRIAKVLKVPMEHLVSGSSASASARGENAAA